MAKSSVTHFLAIRYLKSSQENRFFSWITVLSTIGIAIGVAALIVVLSVINGFEAELRKRFLHANAHVMAFSFPTGMDKPAMWRQVMMQDFGDQIKGISPFIHQETMAKSGPIMHGVLVRGYEPMAREAVQSVNGLIEPPEAMQAIQDEFDPSKFNPHDDNNIPSIVIGAGLKRILNTDVGNIIHLVSPDEGTSKLKSFKIAGVYNSGLKHYDNRLVVMSLPTAQEFFHMGNLVTGVEIGLNNHMDSVAIAAAMQKKYTNLSVKEWQSFNRPLFEAMQKQRLLIAVIVAMVCLVAAFNILTTIFVSVSQKQRDISILKSLGASNKQIVRLFINQGAYIGLIGGAAGGVLAVIISWLLESYVAKIMELPDPYFLRTLPVTYSVSVYLSVITVAFFMCIIAGIYPAIIASKVEPSAGFRGNEGIV